MLKRREIEMKIELQKEEIWKNPRILVLPIETVSRNLDEDGKLHIDYKSHTEGKKGRVVAIERLNDEYCSVMLAGYLT